MLAESEHKKRAAEAISSGIENRPNGIVERNFALISGVSSPKKILAVAFLQQLG